MSQGAAVQAASQTAVQIAAQTGRLDLLTGVLAALAIMIGLSAIPVYLGLRRRAETIARDEAGKVLEGAIQKAEQAAVKRMEEMLPILLGEYRELAENAVDPEDADAIAASYDEPIEPKEG